MTEKLTKKLLVKLIKEEIIKSQLLNEQITKAEIDRRISNAQVQIRFYQRDLRQMRKQGLGVAGGDRLTFQVDRAKGLDYPARIDTLGQASRFANNMIKKFKKEISDLKGLPEYTGLSPAMPQGSITSGGPEIGTPMSTLGFDSLPDMQKMPTEPLQKMPTKKRRRRSRGPYFFRKYRKAGIDKAFVKEFGGKDGLKAAFDRFYDRVNMPKTRKARDYQFGPGHYRKFVALMGKDRQQIPGTKAQKSAVKGGEFASDEAALAQTVRSFAKRYKAAEGEAQEDVFMRAVLDFERRRGKKVPFALQSVIRNTLEQAR